MTGIVVVSHSTALAEAAVALAREMAADARIEVAAGTPDGGFGTDAVAIMEAIGRADTGAGVVVLMDLGSAVLSAELALDLLADDERARVVLCAAPLVEGLIVAAVAAGSGAPAAEVAAEAAGALAGKQAQLGPVASAAESPVVSPVASPAESPVASAAEGRPAGGGAELIETFTVRNPHGLHARPAALLVQAVRELDADVRLRNRTTGTAAVPGRSLSKVATLGALAGHEVEVTAAGRQAREALDRLLALAADGFGELGATPTAGGRAGGGSPAEPAITVAVSPGIGIGPAVRLRPAGTRPPADPAPQADLAAADPTAEQCRLTEALAAVRADIERVQALTARDAGAHNAAIFDAHLLLLDDPDLVEAAEARIAAGAGAGPAWAHAADGIAADFAALPDPYLQARAADVRDVRDQVLLRLAGGTAAPIGADGVLVAPDLTPAQAGALDPARTVAVVLAGGSPTSHAAILLRAKGIPAVVGAVPDASDGIVLAVDGTTGELVVDPPAAVLSDFRERVEATRRRRTHALARAGEAAVTADGVRVLVGANLASAADDLTGADLAGLVRTEFLFLDRDTPPDVDEQEAAYRAIAEAMDWRRITLRTLDVGGDKPLPYVPMPAEANPFLGVRGIRLALDRPQLLADQLEAIVRVARDHPVDVMFPMVSTLDELHAARAMLPEEPPGLRVGIMVEVPATALKAAVFAPHVDFLSIGTNDLTQYALAAERGNDALAALADPLDPGVLALIAATGAVAGPRCLVAVCGELAADERAVPLLIGLGVRELSMSAAAIPLVKEAVRRTNTEAARSLAERALAAGSAAEVRALLG